MSDDKYTWQLGASPPPLDDHSAAKHAVLRQYAATYVEVLTANPRREVLKLTIVDGFAGGGQYTRGGGIIYVTYCRRNDSRKREHQDASHLQALLSNTESCHAASSVMQINR
jgi:three-Cys-motif partner protein